MSTPTDVFKRIDITKLYASFFKLAVELTANCEKRGATFWAISGYRSYAEQSGLYDQGRTKSGKIVTNAKAGQSSHQYGIAIDFCRDADVKRDGLQPSWRLEDYELLAEEAAKLGLTSGMTWKSFKEGPHIELRLPAGVTLGKLDQVHRKHGLEGVFKYLDASGT